MVSGFCGGGGGGGAGGGGGGMAIFFFLFTNSELLFCERINGEFVSGGRNALVVTFKSRGAIHYF